MQNQDRIRQRAHEIWEREGRPEGRYDEHWAQACREIKAESGSAAAAAPNDSATVKAPGSGGATAGEAAAAAAPEGAPAGGANQGSDAVSQAAKALAGVAGSAAEEGRELAEGVNRVASLDAEASSRSVGAVADALHTAINTGVQVAKQLAEEFTASMLSAAERVRELADSVHVASNLSQEAVSMSRVALKRASEAVAELGERVVARSAEALAEMARTAITQASGLADTVEALSRLSQAAVAQARESVLTASRVAVQLGQEVATRSTEALADMAQTATRQGHMLAGAADAANASAQVAEMCRTAVSRTVEALAEAARAAAEWKGGGTTTTTSAPEQPQGILPRAMDRVGDTYLEANGRHAENMQAILTSFAHLSRGMQEWQLTWMGLAQDSLARAGRRWQELAACDSPEAFARLQRDSYADAVEHFVKATTTLMQLGERIIQDASRPLRENLNLGCTNV